MKSFFIDNYEYNIGDIIVLKGEEHHHLSKVLRTKINEIVECFSNGDEKYICEVVSINKEQTTLKLLKKEIANTNPISNLTVFTALLKGDKFEFLITKLTELGVSKLIPFESEFCIGKNVGNKSARYIQIAKDACKQCKRSRILDVEEIITFSQMLSQIKTFDKVFFAYEKETNKYLKELLKDVKKEDNIAIILGSEGGFSEKEAQMIVEKGGISVSLGKRILRAETANVMLASIVLYEMGEYN